MGKLNFNEIPVWKQLKVLNYLNKAADLQGLIHNVYDNPDSGTGSPSTSYTIGEKVGQRILDLRDTFPGKRLPGLASLEEVDGFGQDKLNDLVYSFAQTADEAFRKAMYNGVIFENWHFDYHSDEFTSHEEFLLYARHEGLLKEWASKKVSEIAVSRGKSAQVCDLAGEIIDRSWVEALGDPHLDSHSFALWMYRIDMDNWFSFQKVQNQAELYFNFHGYGPTGIELRMIKGFPNRRVYSVGISADDLPVVVNYAEQRLTLWTSELFD
ncbi:MAG: hypothetical protein H6581_25890 [Bacteroidia bacterium]|nr:hypothetical protein [Bacteroidia bacterium]